MSAYNYETFPLDMEEDVFRAFSDHLHPGDKAPDGLLTDAHTGETVRLKSLWKKGAVCIEFGSAS